MSSTTLALTASPSGLRSRVAWRILLLKLLAAAGLLPLAWRTLRGKT
jgi:hypothetical protein